MAKRCFQHNLNDALQASQLLYAVLLEFLAYEGSSSDHPDYAKIEVSMEFARAHMDQDIGIQEMAASAKLSRHHYSREFKKICGTSPAAWLNKQRIHHAADLLRENNLNMHTIAQACGFSDVNYFGKVFLRIQGTSPGKYRDSGLYG